jgi:hypothetical protein
MLPQSHIAYTVAAFEVLKDRLPVLKKKELDYRWVLLAALGPDVIDKPLAVLYFYRKYRSAVLFAHTLVVHVLAALLCWWKKPSWWPYLLAFNGHAILDRLWFFPNTWYWPWRGWHFHVWQNQQKDIKEAYIYAFTRRPELVIWEVGGLLTGAWLVWRHRLYRWPHLRAFLLTGRLG